ncbi:hypothetical protein C1X30_08640 [Pseudomonas sp. FW305-BF6]|nr:hypothetical protein C1X28_13055 [Pseudomonas sp. FW305-BF15]PNB81419.1 hypothetical protein C1X30_08640 [Pseudomonas sp. FW305-BF6]
MGPSFKTAGQLPPSAGLLLILRPCRVCAGATTGEIPVSRLIHFAHLWRVADALKQGAATSHSPLWRGAATQHEGIRRRHK